MTVNMPISRKAIPATPSTIKPKDIVSPLRVRSKEENWRNSIGNNIMKIDMVCQRSNRWGLLNIMATKQ